MNKLITRTFCLTLALFSATLSPYGFSESMRLFTMKGSNTVGENLAPTLAEHYLKEKIGADYTYVERLEKPNEKRIIGTKGTSTYYIDIHAHGSSTGFKALLKNNTDIALSSRRIKKKEEQSLIKIGNFTHHSAEHIIALDGLAIIVHPDNPIKSLRTEQIAQLFSGQIASWASLGWDDQPITIYARDNQSGTWDTFKQLVLQKRYTLSLHAKRFESNDTLSEHVSKNIYAIGFVSLASINKSKPLAVSDGDSPELNPTTATVATEDYPLSRRLYMYLDPQKHHSHAKAFIEFVQSRAGQSIVTKIGFVSQNPSSLYVEAKSDWPENYTELSQKAKRVSVNFRFAEGSAKLDNKAMQDISRLARYLQQYNSNAIKITLVGFGDKKQKKSRSMVLSKLRASAVKAMLYRQGVKTDPVIGLGDNMPVASNNQSTKFKNQRVEVWLQHL